MPDDTEESAQLRILALDQQPPHPNGHTTPSRMQPTSIRLTAEERERLERLTERYRQRAPIGTIVNMRSVILAAMDALEKRLDALERDRGRQR